MHVSELTDLGLSEEESKVYLATLELGGSYVSTIAKKAGINRVACYHTLDNLLSKQLIATIKKNNMKYFFVESPQLLVNQLEQKFEHAKSILPELLSITNAMAYKPKIQYFEGLEDIERIFEDTLETKELLGYTNLADLPNVIPEKYLKEYTAKKGQKEDQNPNALSNFKKSTSLSRQLLPKRLRPQPRGNPLC